MRMLIALAATTVAALTLACGGDDEESTVEVSLDEWSVTASPSSASSGSVTFTVSNDGDEPHEFLVIRSDLAPDALRSLLTVDSAGWQAEIGAIAEFFDRFGERMLQALLDEVERIRREV